MKNMFKLFILSFATVPFLAFAADTVLNTNKVKVGQKTSASDKVIEFDTNSGAANPKLKVTPATNKIQFSNDGTNYKDIGSGGGGGGGVNFLQNLNGDFETGTSGWTNSGGTFVTSGTLPIEGDLSGVFTASGTGQFIESALITKTLGAGGRSCMATFDYNWAGVLGQLQASVLDSTNAVIAGPIDLDVTTSTQVSSAKLPMFDCDAATQFKVRVTSTAASVAIKVDESFIGYGRNSQQVSQASIFSQVLIAPATATALTAGSFSDFTYAVAPSTTISGAGTAAAGNVAGVTFATMPAGKYEFTANFNFGIAFQSTDTSCTARMYDGVSTGDTPHNTAYTIRQGADTFHSGDDENSLTAVYSFSTTQTAKTFRLQGVRSSGNGQCALGNAHIVVKYYPLNTSNSITLETTGWRVDANIGGGVNPSLGLTSVPTYTSILHGGLVMTQNAGSVPVQIPCDGTNPSTGLTCAVGNENVGVVFNAPTAGPALVCAQFSTLGNIAASAVLEVAFTIAETPNNAQTILQTNNTRIASSSQIAGSVMNFPHNNCGVMNFDTAGQKTLRVMYEQLVAGTVTTSSILADDAGTVGQRNIHITVIPIGNQFPTPIFTDLQNSLRNRISTNDTQQTAIYSANISDTGTCAVDRSVGTWITSVTDNGLGDCTVNFAAGAFDGVFAPLCGFAPGGGATEATIISSTAASIRFATKTSAGAAVGGANHIVCMGKK